MQPSPLFQMRMEMGTVRHLENVAVRASPSPSQCPGHGHIEISPRGWLIFLSSRDFSGPCSQVISFRSPSYISNDQILHISPKIDLDGYYQLWSTQR